MSKRARLPDFSKIDRNAPHGKRHEAGEPHRHHGKMTRWIVGHDAKAKPVQEPNCRSQNDQIAFFQIARSGFRSDHVSPFSSTG
jgi:hypothetical protein